MRFERSPLVEDLSSQLEGLGLAFAGEVGVGLAGWQRRFGCVGGRLRAVCPLAAFTAGSVAVGAVVANEVLSG